MICKQVRIVCLASLFLFFSADALGHGFGPQGGIWGYFRIPDLTQNQKNQMDELWAQYLKEVLLLEAEVRKAEVELQVALGSEKPNQSEIEKIVSEINSIRGKIFSKHVDFVLQVKALLTQEQAKWFSMELIRNPHLVLQRDMMDMPRSEEGFRGGMPRGQHPPFMPPQGLQRDLCEQPGPAPGVPEEPKKRGK